MLAQFGRILIICTVRNLGLGSIGLAITARTHTEMPQTVNHGVMILTPLAESNTLGLLRLNDRKSRHRRIKK